MCVCVEETGSSGYGICVDPAPHFSRWTTCVYIYNYTILHIYDNIYIDRYIYNMEIYPITSGGFRDSFEHQQIRHIQYLTTTIYNNHVTYRQPNILWMVAKSCTTKRWIFHPMNIEMFATVFNWWFGFRNHPLTNIRPIIALPSDKLTWKITTVRR